MPTLDTLHNPLYDLQTALPRALVALQSLQPAGWCAIDFRADRASGFVLELLGPEGSDGFCPLVKIRAGRTQRGEPTACDGVPSAFESALRPLADALLAALAPRGT